MARCTEVATGMAKWSKLCLWRPNRPRPDGEGGADRARSVDGPGAKRRHGCPRRFETSRRREVLLGKIPHVEPRPTWTRFGSRPEDVTYAHRPYRSHAGWDCRSPLPQWEPCPRTSACATSAASRRSKPPTTPAASAPSTASSPRTGSGTPRYRVLQRPPVSGSAALSAAPYPRATICGKPDRGRPPMPRGATGGGEGCTRPGSSRPAGAGRDSWRRGSSSVARHRCAHATSQHAALT